MKKLLLCIFALFVIIPSLNHASTQVDEDFLFGSHAGAYIGANALTGGAHGTYGLDDWLNMEVGVNYILKTNSFLDVYCDLQVLLEITSFWHIYPSLITFWLEGSNFLDVRILYSKLIELSRGNSKFIEFFY